jgi:hypothetical protein
MFREMIEGAVQNKKQKTNPFGRPWIGNSLAATRCVTYYTLH